MVGFFFVLSSLLLSFSRPFWPCVLSVPAFFEVRFLWPRGFLGFLDLGVCAFWGHLSDTCRCGVWFLVVSLVSVYKFVVFEDL